MWRAFKAVPHPGNGLVIPCPAWHGFFIGPGPRPWQLPGFLPCTVPPQLLQQALPLGISERGEHPGTAVCPLLLWKAVLAFQLMEHELVAVGV